MLIFTIISTKGGQGKTTLAANLGALFADLGQRVLLCDADPQPSLTRHFLRTDAKALSGLTQMIRQGIVTPNLITPVSIEMDLSGNRVRRLNPNGCLHLIASDDPKNELQRELDTYVNRAVRIRKALRNPTLHDAYDIAIIDTQGAKGPLQDAAILAATALISPVVPDVPSSEEFVKGTLTLLEGLEGSEDIGVPVPPISAVIYRVENHSISKRYSQGIRENFATLRGKVNVLQQSIPRAVSFLKAADNMVPVHWLDPDSSQVMHHLAWELMPNLEGRQAEPYRVDLANDSAANPADSRTPQPQSAATT